MGVAHIHNLSPQETGARELGTQGQLRLYSGTLSQLTIQPTLGLEPLCVIGKMEWLYVQDDREKFTVACMSYLKDSNGLLERSMPKTGRNKLSVGVVDTRCQRFAAWRIESYLDWSSVADRQGTVGWVKGIWGSFQELRVTISKWKHFFKTDIGRRRIGHCLRQKHKGKVPMGFLRSSSRWPPW